MRLLYFLFRPAMRLRPRHSFSAMRRHSRIRRCSENSILLCASLARTLLNAWRELVLIVTEVRRVSLRSMCIIYILNTRKMRFFLSRQKKIQGLSLFASATISRLSSNFCGAPSRARCNITLPRSSVVVTELGARNLMKGINGQKTRYKTR